MKIIVLSKTGLMVFQVFNNRFKLIRMGGKFLCGGITTWLGKPERWLNYMSYEKYVDLCWQKWMKNVNFDLEKLFVRNFFQMLLMD